MDNIVASYNQDDYFFFSNVDRDAHLLEIIRIVEGVHFTRIKYICKYMEIFWLTDIKECPCVALGIVPHLKKYGVNRNVLADWFLTCIQKKGSGRLAHNARPAHVPTSMLYLMALFPRGPATEGKHERLYDAIESLGPPSSHECLLPLPQQVFVSL